MFYCIPDRWCISFSEMIWEHLCKVGSKLRGSTSPAWATESEAQRGCSSRQRTVELVADLSPKISPESCDGSLDYFSAGFVYPNDQTERVSCPSKCWKCSNSRSCTIAFRRINAISTSWTLLCNITPPTWQLYSILTALVQLVMHHLPLLEHFYSKPLFCCQQESQKDL